MILVDKRRFGTGSELDFHGSMISSCLGAEVEYDLFAIVVL